MYFIKDKEYLATLDLEKVNQLINPFLGDVPVVEYTIIDKGWENILLKIDTYQHSYVLRISTIPYNSVYFNQAEKLIQREIAFVEYLSQNNIPTPMFIRCTNGDFYIRYDCEQKLRFVTLMNFISGTHPNPNIGLIKQVSALQARMHFYAANFFELPYEVNIHYSAMAYRMNNHKIRKTENFPAKLYGELDKLYRITRPELMIYYKNSDKMFIHADVTTNNIFCNDDNNINAIIDFGDCRFSNAAEDIGVFIWDFADKVPLHCISELINTYFDNYSKFSPLLNSTKKISILYAIDRYLIINLHYLIENQGQDVLLKYQINKAEHQLETVYD